MKCPYCGAEIGANYRFCDSCGSQISYEMRREQELVNKVGCPRCGSSNIQFNRENQGEIRGENSKRIVHMTVGFCKDCGFTWYPSEEEKTAPKKHNNTVWWVLGWIFFFPAPIMVLIWRKKNKWDIKVKIAVTVAFWVVLFLIGIFSGGSNSSTNVASHDAINQCYEEMIANNTATNWSELSKQIKELSKKYGLYQDSKNTGTGVRFTKIATTRDESKVISNDDLDKGTYYIRIVADFSRGSPDIQLIDNTK